MLYHRYVHAHSIQLLSLFTFSHSLFIYLYQSRHEPFIKISQNNTWAYLYQKIKICFLYIHRTFSRNKDHVFLSFPSSEFIHKTLNSFYNFFCVVVVHILWYIYGATGVRLYCLCSIGPYKVSIPQRPVIKL